MRKLFTQIHIWLSLPFGIIITIACFTGGLLVFETELQELANPARYYVKEKKEQPMPLSELIPNVNKQLDSLAIANVSISANPEKTYVMSFSGRGRGSVYVNPYTGEIVDQSIGEASFFSKIRQLHRWLLDDSRKIGRPLVGISTLVLVFILISGAIIWLPKRWEHLIKSLKIRTKYGWKRFFFDLHVAGGMYASILLLTYALTGLTWSFEWYRDGFYKVFGVETPANNQQQTRQRGNQGPEQKQGGNRQGGNRQAEKTADYRHWDAVVAQMKQDYKKFKTIRIQDGSVSVGLDQAIGNMRAADQYTFDSKTGEIVEAKLYADGDKASRIRGWIYTVHVGSWGGMLTRILSLIASLIGTLLPITGYYFYFIKKKMVSRKR